MVLASGARPRIRVLLCDDHPLFVEGLERILDADPQMEVVGRAFDGAQAIELARKTQPDVVLLDYTMPNLDGTVATEAIRAQVKNAKILILSMQDNVHYAIKILEAGAHGYALKNADSKELRGAIASVHAGSGYIAPQLVPKIARFLSQGEQRNGIGSLSPREFQFLRYLATGMSFSEIAAAMHCSSSAASTYRSRTLKKLNLDSTNEAIRYAIDNGIAG